MADVLCPKCKSKKIMAEAFMTGKGTVDPNTFEILDAPDYFDFDSDDVDDFFCIDCHHEW